MLSLLYPYICKHFQITCISRINTIYLYICICVISFFIPISDSVFRFCWIECICFIYRCTTAIRNLFYCLCTFYFIYVSYYNWSSNRCCRSYATLHSIICRINIFSISSYLNTNIHISIAFFAILSSLYSNSRIIVRLKWILSSMHIRIFS